MANHACLPNEALQYDVLGYFYASDPISDERFYPTAKVAFNHHATSLTFDGEDFTAPALFCMTDNLPVRAIDKGEGPIVYISFQPGSIFRLLGVDGRTTAEGIHLAGVGKFPKIAELAAHTKAAGDNPLAIFKGIDDYLISRLPFAPNYGLADRFRFLAWKAQGTMSVSAAADILGTNNRALERDCRKRLGRTPKRIARGIRIFFALRDINLSERPMPEWSQFEGADLFSDQSHFLRDAKSLTGLTPNEHHRTFSGHDRQWHSYSQIGTSLESDQAAQPRDDSLPVKQPETEVEAIVPEENFGKFAPEVVEAVEAALASGGKP